MLQFPRDVCHVHIPGFLLTVCSTNSVLFVFNLRRVIIQLPETMLSSSFSSPLPHLVLLSRDSGQHLNFLGPISAEDLKVTLKKKKKKASKIAGFGKTG